MTENLKKPEEITADVSPPYDFSDEYFLDDDSFKYPHFTPVDDIQVIIPIVEAGADGGFAERRTDKTAEKKPLTVSLHDVFFDFCDFMARFVVSIPSLVEKTGEITVGLIVSFFEKYGVIIALPFVLLATAVKKAFISVKNAIAAAPKNFSNDLKNIRYELKIIRRQLRSAEHKTQLLPLKVMRKYFVISFSRHDMFWKTVFNTAFPIVLIALSLSFFSHINKTVFALDVIYNGVHIGYVESEDAFEKAKTEALKLMPESLDAEQKDSLEAEPTYKLGRVYPNRLSNQSMVTENLIAASKLPLERACGIYIDGEFLCAVKNESDAVSVFNSLLLPSRKKASADAIVAFVEEVNYVQGLYPADSGVIWDSAKLKKTLNAPKSKAIYHKVKSGDTAKSIAKKYSLTTAQLKAYNPNVDFNKLVKGKRLLVSAETDYVRVKVMRTAVKTQSIPYETIKKESSSLLKGTTKVVQNGSAGKKVITELVTYINGKKTYSTVVSTKQIKAPVNKIIQIGTKSIYSSPSGSPYYSGGSSSGFIWPARGAYTLSSRFGYRSASISGWSFHGGIDIIKAGGHSTGIPVVAAASGTVVVAYAGYSGYGNTVVIDHGNGLRTRYAHMQPGSIAVRVGQRVYQGQQVGRIGSTGNVTGPHLHFEVLRNGSKVNPLNYVG